MPFGGIKEKRERGEKMIISAQVALYPLSRPDIDQIVSDAVAELEKLKEEGLQIEVGSMSSVLRGEEELVWRAIRTLFSEGGKKNPVVLHVTVSNECGC